MNGLIWFDLSINRLRKPSNSPGWTGPTNVARSVTQCLCSRGPNLITASSINSLRQSHHRVSLPSGSATAFQSTTQFSRSVSPGQMAAKGMLRSLGSSLSALRRCQGLYQDLVIPVTNFNNEDKGFMVLAGDVFDVPVRKDIIHRVVRWQLAKRQQGTHSTKSISEVSGTGRKPWNQKGTGRARHGSLRGPQFRGGCVVHGPKPRSHEFKLNKKVRRLGLKIALTNRAAEGKLIVFDDLDVPTHKTKNIVSYVQQMENTKKLLLVDGDDINEKLKLATQNLHYVNVLPAIGLNVYSMLLHDTLVMSRSAVNKIVERMHTPINR
ncbi:50S ribosomal protein L4 [Linum perenne]